MGLLSVFLVSLPLWEVEWNEFLCADEDLVVPGYGIRLLVSYSLRGGILDGEGSMVNGSNGKLDMR